MYRIFCIHDNDEVKKRLGAFEINENQVEDYNNNGFGVFWIVNEFNGDRKAINCTKINYYYADMDEDTKENQMELIKKLPIHPTMIIETKKGHHCYWKVSNATIENFADVEKGLIKRLNADKHCTDVSRLLRYPYSYHMKDKNNSFLIQVIYDNDKEYTESQMLCAYKIKEKAKVLKRIEGDISDFVKPENWERIFKISQIFEGGRNSMLARYALWLIDLKIPNNQICYVIEGLNQKMKQPLPEWEIKQLLKGKGLL